MKHERHVNAPVHAVTVQVQTVHNQVSQQDCRQVAPMSRPESSSSICRKVLNPDIDLDTSPYVDPDIKAGNVGN